MKSAPTMKDVATAAGVCPATVSLALRNHPSIPENTRERIRKVAEDLGYRPNPRISELMTHIRKTRSATANTETVAMIWADVTRTTIQNMKNLQHFQATVNRRLTENGFGLTVFHLDKALSATRLETMLHNRGVRGVILAPLMERSEMSLDWNWRNFSVIIAGSAWWRPEFNRVRFNHFAEMRVMVEEIQNKGYSRIGLVIERNLEERSQHAIDGGFWGAVPAEIRKSDAVFELDEPKAGRLSSWVASYQPDCLIFETIPPAPLRKQIPPHLPIFLRSLPESTAGPHPPGILQNWPLLGQVAADQLMSQLQLNQSGVPSHPIQSLIQGEWVEAPEPSQDCFGRNPGWI